MPSKPLRPCANRGCPNAGTVRGMCPEHAIQREAQYEQGRGTAAQRGYDVKWRRIRAQFLKFHPYCENHPLEASVDVDHRISKRDGGTDEWSNLAALCHSCHSKKTSAQDHRWGR